MSAYYEKYEQLNRRIAQSRADQAMVLIKELENLGIEAGDDEVIEDAVERRLSLASELGDLPDGFAAFNQLTNWHRAGRVHLGPSVWLYYKWIAAQLPEYPSLTRQAIWTFLDRMEACYVADKQGLRPVYMLRMHEAAFAGQQTEADQWMTKWQNEPSAESDDCVACETHSKVEALLNLGRSDEAIAAAEPILKGELSCDDVPYTTCSRLLLPLLRSGDLHQSELCHLDSVRAVRKMPNLVRHLAEHVLYLSITGRSQRAARLVAIMLVRSEGSQSGLTRFRVAVATWIWSVAEQLQGQTHARLPHRLSWAPADQMIPLNVLAVRGEDEARDLASQFDARNGTDVFAQRIKSLESLVTLMHSQAPSN